MLLLLRLCGTVAAVLAGELLQNGGFESLHRWTCTGRSACTLSEVSHSGYHALKVADRRRDFDGPKQNIEVTSGQRYSASAYVKMLTDMPGIFGEVVKLQMIFNAIDGTKPKVPVAVQLSARASDGWIALSGHFTAPNAIHSVATFKVLGPRPGVEFLVDDASFQHLPRNTSQNWRNVTDHVIDRLRKSDLHVSIISTGHYNIDDLNIQVLQTRKSFPFGAAIKANEYNANAANGKYRAFIHQHFNWAVLANSLKWPFLELKQGKYKFQRPLDAVNRLRSHGLKVRGHNLVWSLEDKVPEWVKKLSGDTLRQTVQHHMEQTMNETRGLLEHWDVNNENLHGQWYQEALQDPDYDLELFRIARRTDPTVKLFLNDNNVVNAGGGYARAYVQQAQRLKAADVGLYAMGAQCHFNAIAMPDPLDIKERLDILAEAGLPVWATELDTADDDEDKRADKYEIALRSLYGHPAVEGIMLWVVWDKVMRLGEPGSLNKGDNFEMTAAGRRVLDLLEKEWMTDETHSLSQSVQNLIVRGFHGDYEVRVHYKGQLLSNATKNVSLGREGETVHITL